MAADIELYNRISTIEIVTDDINVEFVEKAGRKVRGDDNSLVIYEENDEGEEVIVKKINYYQVITGSYTSFRSFIEFWFDKFNSYNKLSPERKTTPEFNTYDHQIVAEETTLIDLKSNYGLSDLRDRVDTTGTGSVSHTGVDFKLETTASGNGTASLTTKESGVYVGGATVRAGVQIIVPAKPPKDIEYIAGPYDDLDGFQLRFKEGDGVYVARKRNGSMEDIIYQEGWNVDSLDGNGPSGIVLKPEHGIIFNVYYPYYGIGPVEFVFHISDEHRISRRIVIHRMEAKGQVSVNNPNLPIRSEIIDNSGTTSSGEFFVGTRHISLQGKYMPSNRISGEKRTGVDVSTTIVPIISARRKSSFNGVSARVEGYNVGTDQAIFVYVFSGSRLVGANFTDPEYFSPNETAFEYDNDATAFDVVGNPVYGPVFISGGDKKNETGLGGLFGLNFNVPDEDLLTIAAVRAKTTNAIVDTSFRVKEEW